MEKGSPNKSNGTPRKDFKYHLKAFGRFFISPMFWINVALIGLAWFGVIWGLSSYLESETGHGERKKVPNFIGMHVDDLPDFAQGAGVKYEIVDSVFRDDFPKGTVCTQYPLPTDSTGMFIKESVVRLAVVPFGQRMVALPSLDGMNRDVMDATLRALKISYKPTLKYDSRGPGFVLAAFYKGDSLKSKSKVPVGARIDVVISKATGELVALPNLKGMTVIQAEELLGSGLRLNVRCSPPCVTKQDQENAVIYKQIPDPMTGQVYQGSTIMVEASTDPTSIPNEDTTSGTLNAPW